MSAYITFEVARIATAGHAQRFLGFAEVAAADKVRVKVLQKLDSARGNLNRIRKRGNRRGRSVG